MREVEKTRSSDQTSNRVIKSAETKGHTESETQRSIFAPATTDKKSEITTQSAIHTLREGKSVSWRDTPVDVVREVLEQAARERECPPSRLGVNDLKASYKFLKDRSLRTLYNTVYEAKEREDIKAPKFLLEQTGIKVKPEDLIEEIKLGKKISWSDMPGEAIQGTIESAAEELGIHPLFLERKHLTQPLKKLDGKNLSSLYLFALNAKDRGEKDPMKYVLDKINVTMTVEDVLEPLRQKKSIPLSRVSGKILHQIMDKMGKEIGVPPSMLGEPDFTKQHYNFLNGLSLPSLYSHFVYEGQKEEKSGISLLHEKAGTQVKAEELLTILRSDRVISWERVPGTVVGEVISQAAQEINAPPSMFARTDFRRKYDSLNGHTLGGYYQHAVKSEERGDKSVLAFIHEQTGIKASAEDVVKAIKLKRGIPWKDVSDEAVKSILKQAATELGKPASMLGTRNLQSPFAFLGGRTLGGLYNFLQSDPERNKKDPILHFKEKTNIDTLTDDVIEAIVDGRTINWKGIPTDAIRGLAEKMAQSLPVPLGMLRPHHFNTHFDFLGGKTLGGLYDHLRREKKDKLEPTVSYFKKKLDIPDMLMNSDVFHKSKMNDLLIQYTNEHPINNPTPKDLLPWIREVSEIYEDPFMNIEKEEVQNELFLFLTDYLSTDEVPDNESLVKNAHRYIERYVSQIRSDRYKKSFATEISYTESAPISTKDTPTENVIFSQKTNQVLERLNPLQKALVIGVTVQDYTFEEIAPHLKEQFGEELDSDMLQDHYEEALMVLRGDLNN